MHESGPWGVRDEAGDKDIHAVLVYCGVLEPSWHNEGVHTLRIGRGAQCLILELNRPEKSILAGVGGGLARCEGEGCVHKGCQNP